MLICLNWYNTEFFTSEYVSRFKNKKEREDVTWRNTKGESRLHEAAKIGNATEVEKLIRSGQNVNAVDYAGWTPLMVFLNYSLFYI